MANTQLKDHGDRLEATLHLLRDLRDRLNSDGKELPIFFFDIYTRNLEFHSEHARRIGEAFGPDGWIRKATVGGFNWGKSLPCGLRVTITNAEQVRCSQTEVSPDLFSTLNPQS